MVSILFYIIEITFSESTTNSLIDFFSFHFHGFSCVSLSLCVFVCVCFLMSVYEMNEYLSFLLMQVAFFGLKTVFKGAISGLRRFLGTESPLK